MKHVPAFAKINLALVVGPLRSDGKHEIVTVLQKIHLHDDVELEPADSLAVEGFHDDTLVTSALERLSEKAGTEARWRIRIEKRIPVAAGLGGGSADAAAALSLANSELREQLPDRDVHDIACRVGSDVPFFLTSGPQLATGDGTRLEPIDLPSDYHVLILLPHGRSKASTGDVYRAFDARGGAHGFEERRVGLLEALRRVRQPCDLVGLPKNDLVEASESARLEELGAFRADVSGAGPAVYGLFESEEDAERAATKLRGDGRTWLTRPA